MSYYSYFNKEEEANYRLRAHIEQIVEEMLHEHGLDNPRFYVNDWGTLCFDVLFGMKPNIVTCLDNHTIRAHHKFFLDSKEDNLIEIRLLVHHQQPIEGMATFQVLIKVLSRSYQQDETFHTVPENYQINKINDGN